MITINTLKPFIIVDWKPRSHLKGAVRRCGAFYSSDVQDALFPDGAFPKVIRTSPMGGCASVRLAALHSRAMVTSRHPCQISIMKATLILLVSLLTAISGTSCKNEASEQGATGDPEERANRSVLKQGPMDSDKNKE